MQPLPPGADEVGVQHPLAILRVLHQQPATTLPTHHRAFEEVVVRALPLIRAPRSEHLLHGLPRLAVYQWLMRTDIVHSLE